MTTHQPDPQADRTVHVSFLLDRSGSMEPIRADVIGGFNQFVSDQQAQPGTCRMTVVQFDTNDPFDVMTDALDVHEVRPLDSSRYVPRGGTPLLDALGQLLEHAERRARGRNEDPVVVVFTDGEENASHRWTHAAIFQRIGVLKAQGWTFVFMGANQDSYAEAGGLGFMPGSTSNFDPARADRAFGQTSRAVRSYRSKSAAERAVQKQDFFEGVKEAEQGTSGKSR